MQDEVLASVAVVVRINYVILLGMSAAVFMGRTDTGKRFTVCADPDPCSQSRGQQTANLLDMDRTGNRWDQNLDRQRVGFNLEESIAFIICSIRPRLQPQAILHRSQSAALYISHRLPALRSTSQPSRLSIIDPTMPCSLSTAGETDGGEGGRCNIDDARVGKADSGGEAGAQRHVLAVDDSSVDRAVITGILKSSKLQGSWKMKICRKAYLLIDSFLLSF